MSTAPSRDRQALELLNWPRQSGPAKAEAMGHVIGLMGEVLEQFGWHRVSDEFGNHRWFAFSAEGQIAVAELLKGNLVAEFQIVYGDEHAMCWGRLELILTAIRRASQGFGRTPSDEVLHNLIARVVADAGCKIPGRAPTLDELQILGRLEYVRDKLRKIGDMVAEGEAIWTP